MTERTRGPSGRRAREAKRSEGGPPRGATGDREGRERPAQPKEKGAARRVRQQFAVTSDRPRTGQREQRHAGCLSQPACRSGSGDDHGAGVTSPPAPATRRTWATNDVARLFFKPTFFGFANCSDQLRDGMHGLTEKVLLPDRALAVAFAKEHRSISYTNAGVILET